MSGQPIKLSGDGLTIFGEAFGDPSASPVLFFHGGGQSRGAWREAARTIGEAGYRGVTCDLRGHGDSEWAPDGDYFLDAYARDVAALIDAVGRPVALVGASRGGQAALVGATRRPDKTSLVMLADVAPLLRDEGIDAVRGFFRASSAGFANLAEASKTLSLYLDLPERPAPFGLEKMMRRGDDARLYWKWDPRTVQPQFLNPPSEGIAIEQAAASIACPVILVRAELSTIVTEESVSRFRALTPQLEVIVAHGVGHMYSGDRNDAFASTLLAHLARYMPLP